VLTQALAKQIKPLVTLKDDLQTDTIARYKQLCTTCGCRNEQKLSLDCQRRSQQSANLVSASWCNSYASADLGDCGRLGVQARLPACLSLGKAERDTS
jgi:microcystin degradation protein MlrC